MSKAKIKKVSNKPADKNEVNKGQVIAKTGITEIKSDKKDKTKIIGRLARLNKWLAIGYGVQALALMLFSVGRVFPVTVHFLGKDTLASQAVGHSVYAAASQHLFDVSLPQILALSLTISAVLHAIIARWLRRQYATWLDEGSNPLRWLDGAFSASLLPVAIGLVAGLADVASMALLFILGFATHLLGLYMEAYNQKFTQQKTGISAAQDFRPFMLLCITGATVWLVLGSSVLSAVIFGAGLPPGVWLAYIFGIICVSAYTVVMLRTYRRAGRFADYRYTELVSVILSFVAKSGIAWLLFSAVLKP